MSRIEVEFYGIARLRAGVATAAVSGRTIAAAWEASARLIPALADIPRTALLISINGERFSSDWDEPLDDGTRLVVLSADAGG